MAFDIKKTNLAEQAEAGYEFEVKLPDGSSTDFYITVRGNLSPKVKKFSKDLFNQLQLKELQANLKTLAYTLSHKERRIGKFKTLIVT